MPRHPTISSPKECLTLTPHDNVSPHLSRNLLLREMPVHNPTSSCPGTDFLPFPLPRHAQTVHRVPDNHLRLR